MLSGAAHTSLTQSHPIHMQITLCGSIISTICVMDAHAFNLTYGDTHRRSKELVSQTPTHTIALHKHANYLMRVDDLYNLSDRCARSKLRLPDSDAHRRSKELVSKRLNALRPRGGEHERLPKQHEVREKM